jgi:hypothetical protein
MLRLKGCGIGSFGEAKIPAISRDATLHALRLKSQVAVCHGFARIHATVLERANVRFRRSPLHSGAQ